MEYLSDKTDQELKEFKDKHKDKRERRQYSREELIKRYENIVERWNNDGDLIRLFPEKYEEICMKLQALKDGAKYRVYDATYEVADMVMDMGAKIRDIQQMHDGTGRVLKDYKKSKYKYKTDIPDFVDKIIDNKLYK